MGQIAESFEAMRQVSTKRRARLREVTPFREELKLAVGRCEVCGLTRLTDDLAIHEICNGPFRERALDKAYALLVVCRYPNFRKQTDCHREVQQWPEAKQLALLYMRKSSDYDLRLYNSLVNPRAPNRITQAEVDVEIKRLLEAGR